MGVICRSQFITTDATNVTNATSKPTDDSGSSETTVFIIAGSGGGGAVLIIVVIAFVCYCKRRQRSGMYAGDKGGDMVMPNMGTMRSTSFAMESNLPGGVTSKVKFPVGTCAFSREFMKVCKSWFGSLCYNLSVLDGMAVCLDICIVNCIVS
jgi:hypothetical protein